MKKLLHAFGLLALAALPEATIAENITTNNGSVDVTETSPGNWLIEVPGSVMTLVEVVLLNDSSGTPDDFGVITIENLGAGGVEVTTPFDVGDIEDIHAIMSSPVTLLNVRTGSIGGVRVSNWEGGEINGNVGGPTPAGKIELVGIGGDDETWDNVTINGNLLGDVTCNGRINGTVINGSVGTATNAITMAVKSNLLLDVTGDFYGDIHNTTSPTAGVDEIQRLIIDGDLIGTVRGFQLFSLGDNAGLIRIGGEVPQGSAILFDWHLDDCDGNCSTPETGNC